MPTGYHKINRKVLQFDCEKDVQKIIFNHYLMRKENLNNLSKNLPQGHLPLTVRTVAKDLGMSIGAVHRMIKVFEDMGIIERVQNGKKSKTASIFKYNSNISNSKNLSNTTTNNENHTNSNTVLGTDMITDFGTSKIEDINNKNLENWILEYGI